MAILGFLIALIVTVNPYIPSIATHVRVLDLLSIVAAPAVFCYVAYSKRFFPAAIGAVLVIFLELPWIFTDSQTAGILDGSLSLRWLELTVFALSLLVLSARRAFRGGFALGIIGGAIINCIIMWLQSLGYSSTLVKSGLAFPSFSRIFAGSASMERFSGLHGHPNAAAGVVGLCIPAAIALNTEFKRSWLLVPGAAGICVAGALLTYSRSSFAIAGLLLVFWLYRLRTANKRLLVIGLSLCAIAFVGSSLIPSLNQRWSVDAGSETNASVRLDTTERSAATILQYPLGLGSNFEDDAGLDLLATHNAFTHLALAAGVPLAALVFLSIAISAFRLRTENNLPTWLACYLMGIFFFEEHLRNPTIVTLALWLVLIYVQRMLGGMVKGRKSSRPALARSVYEKSRAPAQLGGRG